MAEKDGSLDRVEDELFRFGRILDREPELARLLSDSADPPTSASGCCTSVVGEKVAPVTATLLEQAVRTPAQPQPRRGRPRSSPSSPRPAATATWPTSAPPSG